MRRLAFAALSAFTLAAAPATAATLDPAVDCGTREAAARELCARANSGDVAAQVTFAQQLFDGRNGPVDVETAVAIYRVAAREGNADATALLGSAYEQGLLGEPDDVAARALFRTASEMGSQSAQGSYGDYLVRGLGGPRQTDEGMRLLRGAVERNDRDAMLLLGSLLNEGVEGVPKNEAEGARLVRRAADAGQPVALNLLATNALRASGDLTEAQGFAEKAVEAAPNNGLFVDTLATIVNRRGDPTRALTLYARAAELAPGCSMCLVRYADLLAARNRRNDARRVYRQAIEANQDQPDPEFNEEEIRRRSR